MGIFVVEFIIYVSWPQVIDWFLLTFNEWLFKEKMYSKFVWYKKGTKKSKNCIQILTSKKFKIGPKLELKKYGKKEQKFKIEKIVQNFFKPEKNEA